LVIPGSIQGIVWAVDTGAGVVCLICVCWKIVKAHYVPNCFFY
jgi:hypothetical protein